MIDTADRMLDWEHMVEAIEQTEPIHPPGERTGYHGLTYGYLVGEILQRVTGESFPDLVRKELESPSSSTAASWGRRTASCPGPRS